ncbi:MAG: RNA polymerase sigma-70 factor (ECF subfamily) [Limisphaerales bacterium]|jgi:RNA polymerase sigma-70 factor (ECF subfamily)
MESRRQLETIYDEHADALFAFLINLHRNEDTAREVLQELFKKLAQQPECLDAVRNPRSFLIRMAHQLAIDLVRRRETRDASPKSSEFPG